MSVLKWQELPAPDRDTRTFISYRSTAVDLATAVERSLLAAGDQVWRDKSSLKASDDWQQEIQRHIAWCQRVILLLTPETLTSGEVLKEITAALEQGRRVEPYCLGEISSLETEALKTNPDENGLEQLRAWKELISTELSKLHIVEIPRGEGEDQRLCDAILTDHAATHPMDAVQFRRVFASRMLSADELQGLPPAQVQSYLANRKNPVEDGPCLTANYCLMLANNGKIEQALAVAEDAVSLEHPLLDLYLSALLCERKRPGVLPPTRRQRAIASAQRAFQATHAPLMGLHLCLMLWDVGSKRGPGAAQMINSALQAIAESQPDREELLRYLLIFEVEKLQGPTQGAEMKRLLQQVGAA